MLAIASAEAAILPAQCLGLYPLLRGNERGDGHRDPVLRRERLMPCLPVRIRLAWEVSCLAVVHRAGVGLTGQYGPNRALVPYPRTQPPVLLLGRGYALSSELGRDGIHRVAGDIEREDALHNLRFVRVD